MSNNRLQMRFALLAADYIEAFTTKHKVDFDGWVGECIGGIACFGDYYFNFDDIRYDVDYNVRGRKIFRWLEEGVEHNFGREEPQHINYENYCLGLRYKNLNKKKRFTKEQKQEQEILRAKIEGLKEEIERMGLCNTCDKITVFDNGVCTECNN